MHSALTDKGVSALAGRSVGQPARESLAWRVWPGLMCSCYFSWPLLLSAGLFSLCTHACLQESMELVKQLLSSLPGMLALHPPRLVAASWLFRFASLVR
jgi:hypothetical protein